MPPVVPRAVDRQQLSRQEAGERHRPGTRLLLAFCTAAAGRFCSPLAGPRTQQPDDFSAQPLGHLAAGLRAPAAAAPADHLIEQLALAPQLDELHHLGFAGPSQLRAQQHPPGDASGGGVMEQHSLGIGTDLHIGHGNRRRERRSDGTEPSRGLTQAGPRLERPGASLTARMKETWINATVELQRQVSDGLHQKVETCEYGITPGLRGAEEHT